MIEERNLNENDIIIRIGLDGGGGFVKICLSVFKSDSEEEGDEGGQGKTKRLTQRFQDSGVKKAMVVACVPDIQENYFNIKRLWVESGIDKLTRKFTIAIDLKLCNILLGLMSHSSSHPCSWCDVSKDELTSKGASRTIENLMNLFWKFWESDADLADAKNYGNVIHPTMFASSDIFDESTPIICVLPPPELHVLIGPVNTLYEELSSRWDGIEEWINKLNVKREEYHGGSFNGNDSR